MIITLKAEYSEKFLKKFKGTTYPLMGDMETIVDTKYSDMPLPQIGSTFYLFYERVKFWLKVKDVIHQSVFYDDGDLGIQVSNSTHPEKRHWMNGYCVDVILTDDPDRKQPEPGDYKKELKYWEGL